jgi:nucleotide-binding universal stress UspA family protein
MMKRILIAADGSAPSTEALEVGLELAAAEEAKAIVVHVIPSLETLPVGGFGMSSGAVAHTVTEADRAPLEAALELAKQRGVEIETALLRGSTVSQITAYADEQDVDLVVVGSRGHNVLTTALLGSVSMGVLHHTRRPVLVVRALAPKEAEKPEDAVLA